MFFIGGLFGLLIYFKILNFIGYEILLIYFFIACACFLDYFYTWKCNLNTCDGCEAVNDFIDHIGECFNSILKSAQGVSASKSKRERERTERRRALSVSSGAAATAL